MKLFARRRRADGRLPTYSNESVIETIERDAGVDRATARTWFNEMLIFLDLATESKDFISTGAPDPGAYRRAYDRRRSRGSLDPAVWAVPAVAVESGDAGGGSEWGWGGGDAGGGSACGGGGGGGGGGA